MQTQVCLTIDTEFSIGGAFTDSNKRPVAEPYVWCDVAGRSEGLGFLLRTFQKYGTTATFFVEALHRQYFRNDPMRAIARQIVDNGHEVQLHAHPCWSVFQYEDWPERIRRQPRQDDFFGRKEEDSLALIQKGMETFVDWGLPPPMVFRSGNLQHDDALYRAISRAKIPFSSNIGLAIFNSGNPRFQLYAGCHDCHGVLECPILTFTDWMIPGKKHVKSLTIAGTSFAETRNLIEEAERHGIHLVVILTHPFEYIQSRSASFGDARRHVVNQHRLLKLCRFLSQNRDRFPTTGLAVGIGAFGMKASGKNPLLKSRLWQSVGRMVGQAFYEHAGRLPLDGSRGEKT